MDFFEVNYRTSKRGSLEVYPNFIVCDSKDFMVRGKSFYAVWNEDAGVWSQNEFDVVRLVDKELFAYADKLREHSDDLISVMTMSDFGSRSWNAYNAYLAHFPDNYITLDNKLMFANDIAKKEDYVSKKLPYALSDGECPNWDELVSVLYTPQERKKIEWAIGSVFAGDSIDIQKFLVFYGTHQLSFGRFYKLLKQVWRAENINPLS